MEGVGSFWTDFFTEVFSLLARSWTRWKWFGCWLLGCHWTRAEWVVCRLLARSWPRGKWVVRWLLARSRTRTEWVGCWLLDCSVSPLKRRWDGFGVVEQFPLLTVRRCFVRFECLPGWDDAEGSTGASATATGTSARAPFGVLRWRWDLRLRGAWSRWKWFGCWLLGCPWTRAEWVGCWLLARSRTRAEGVVRWLLPRSRTRGEHVVVVPFSRNKPECAPWLGSVPYRCLTFGGTERWCLGLSVKLRLSCRGTHQPCPCQHRR